MLDSDARHEAQVAGVIDAYLSGVSYAHWRTLAAIKRELRPDENLHAAGSCFWRGGLRIGLLFITDQRLIWIKQAYIRRRPRTVRLPYGELRKVEGYFETDDKWSYLVASWVDDRRPAEKFSLTPWSTEQFEFIRPVLARELGEKYGELVGAPLSS
jgi:hypothetical protein